MGNYDFKSLSPSDFEDLCKDLLEIHLEKKLQVFTTGRDGGIDLRYSPAMDEKFRNHSGSRDVIVQCKHYAGSRFDKLKVAVKREIPKLNKLNPARYVLATSVSLTPQNVDELVSMLSPYCLSSHDILGMNQLNALLRNHPDIERNHPKLWVTSEGVLQTILNAGVRLQGAFTEDTIRHRMNLYVYTERYRIAANHLEENRVTVLTGAPGVGKTTLSEMLLLSHLAEGWELVRIQQNVSEGLNIYSKSPEKKQIFYYDDFLGQISVGEKLAKNEDDVLLQLIHEVRKNRYRRFILTTREYILAQVKTQHEKLGRSNIDFFKLVVECKNYSDIEKTRMLVNHLYFNEIPKSYIAALSESVGYSKIIRHRNYNPRLIESMTGEFVKKSFSESEYLTEFLSLLDNPDELWKHPFENHLCEASRCLILVLATCGRVFLADLSSAFEKTYRARCDLFNQQFQPNAFQQAMQEIEGDFVQVECVRELKIVDFSNPSLLDFASRRLSTSTLDVSSILGTCVAFEQVERLASVLHVILPRFGDNASPSYRGKEAEIKIRDAILRTINVPPIAVEAGVNLKMAEMFGWKQEQVYQFRDHWSRLQLCFRIAAVHKYGLLRKAVVGLFNQCFIGLNESDYTANALELLGMAEKQDWIDEAVKNKWKTICSRNITLRDDFSNENIQELRSIAWWSYANEILFSEDDFIAITERLKKSVLLEVEERINDTHGEAEWETLYSETDELQMTFSCDFDDLLHEINVGWQEWRRNDLEDYSVDRTPNKSVQEVRNKFIEESTVKSIFESLLE